MNKQKGFTLLESLTAVVIMMIVALITVSSLTYLSDRGRDENLRLSLMQVMQEGRAEADNLNKTITLCTSKDQQQCGGQWTDGLMLFIDEAGDGKINRADQILSVTEIKARDGYLHSRFYPSYRDFVQFQPAAHESADNGSIWFCHPNAQNPVWAIRVNRMGIAESVKPDKSGEIRDGHGIALRCNSHAEHMLG